MSGRFEDGSQFEQKDAFEQVGIDEEYTKEQSTDAADDFLVWDGHDKFTQVFGIDE